MHFEFDTLGFAIGEAARLLRDRFDDYAGMKGVTRAQWRMLIALMRQEPISQVKLAQYLEVEPMSLCRMADRLQAAGMVERHPDPNDRRINLLSLSNHARGLMVELRVYGSKVLDVALEGFSAPQQDEFMRYLTRFCDNLTSERVDALLKETLTQERAEG